MAQGFITWVELCGAWDLEFWGGLLRAEIGKHRAWGLENLQRLSLWKQDRTS